jgi:hypothetical protein
MYPRLPHALTTTARVAWALVAAAAPTAPPARAQAKLVARQRSHATASTTTARGFHRQGHALADIDGHAEVVCGNGDAVAWRNHGGGSFGEPTVSDGAGGCSRTTRGDFEGEVKLDTAGVDHELDSLGENRVTPRGLRRQRRGAVRAP